MPRPAAGGGEARRTDLGHDERVTGTSFSFLYGPLVATAALGVIVLICRWVFAPPPAARTRPAPGTPAATASRQDYGLLEPVATCRTPEDAALLRDVLREAGLRGTLADGATPGEVVVLVFRDDAARARALVRG
jgi:hypothetical protein